jgi:acyl-CoA synthetase (AMP-forming)/AMP-acid ligase II
VQLAFRFKGGVSVRDIVLRQVGATEAAARLSYLEPRHLLDRIDAIGKAIPGVALRVLRENVTEADPFEVGELVASGSNIMQGYWRDAEATAAALSSGWYRTGDQAYVDDEGFFFLQGRKDDLIKVEGHRLNPQEIEDALMASGLLTEAVVLGVPDEFLGNKLVALAVAINNSCTQHDAIDFCAKSLPRFKVPSEVVFVKSIPKKPSGKTDRSACRQLLLDTRLDPDFNLLNRRGAGRLG